MLSRIACLILLWTAGTAAAEDVRFLPRLLPATFTPSEINSCLEAACGPASSYTSAVSVFENRATTTPDNTKEFWKHEIRPLILEHAKSRVEFQKAMDERMSFAQSSGRNPQTLHPLLILVRKNLLLQSLQLESVVKPVPRSEQVVLNPEGLLEAVKNLPAEKKESAISLIKSIVIPMKRLSIARLISNGSSLTARLNLLYPSLPTAEAQKWDATKILDAREKLAAIFDPLTFHLLVGKDEKELFARAQGGAELNSFESDLYFESAKEIESLSEVFLNPTNLSLLSKINFDENEVPNSRTKLPSFKFLGLDSGANGARLDEELLNKESNNCLRRFSASQGLNSSALRIQKMRELVTQVKVAAKSALAKIWQSSYKDSPDAVIDAIDFEYADPVEVYLRRFKDRLATKQKRNLEAAKILRDLSNQKTDETLKALLIFAGSTTPEQNMEESELRAACELFPIAGATDFSVLETGKISVSWFASSYPEFAAGIVSHEMGHLISEAILAQSERGNSVQNFLRLRTCVTNRNPFVLEPRSGGFLNDSRWSEEDFADFFSSQVLNELALSGSPYAVSKNLGCSLLDNKRGTYAAVTNLEPQKNGPHSSAFLRMLMIGVDRGSLPTQCQRFLDYASANNRNLTCQ